MDAKYGTSTPTSCRLFPRYQTSNPTVISLPRASQLQKLFQHKPKQGDNYDDDGKQCEDFQRHSHILLTLANGLRTGYLSDVTFILGETTIPAHKLILSFASPVFDTMFNGSLPEQDCVTVTDVCPDAFRVLLQHLYTSQYPIPEDLEQDPAPEELINVLYAARKYDIPELEKKVSSHLEDLISLETFIPILEASLLYEQASLENKCWHCLEYNSDKFFHSEAFLQLRESTLDLILRRDCLSITELKVFNQVLRWAEVECQRKNLDPGISANIRHVLGNVLPLIRFPTMKSHEFADGPAASGVLTDQEVGSILLHICSTTRKPVVYFESEHRRWRNPEIYSECFCNNNNSRTSMNSMKSARNCNFCHLDQSMEDKGQGFLNSPCTPPRYCPCKTRAYCPLKRRFGPH
ncbi:unnamed protein product [Allacma fusca]|uniref:BTB domain-containing protein n=1 Tax=Allacma fusca TaxID=39272 RepID=A0A8J2KXR5_9HEXA|nr:unnamed protein product [Allacma fusca]